MTDPKPDTNDEETDWEQVLSEVPAQEDPCPDNFDLTPDYAHYRSMDSWSVDEAASLLCDVRPGELHRYVSFDGRYASLSEEVLEADEGFIWGKFFQFLRCRRLILRALASDKLSAYEGKGPKAFLDPREVLAWAITKPDATPSSALIDKLNDDSPVAKIELDDTGIPAELQYSTRLIEAMRKAIKRFWLAGDPDRPPKSFDVKSWIKKNCDVSSHEAEMIDAMIRPDSLKKGGRKKLKRPTPKKGTNI